MSKKSIIEQLSEKIKSGEINESELEITLDNDETIFCVNGEKIDLQGEGYYDAKPLYKSLFPEAKVEWC